MRAQKVDAEPEARDEEDAPFDMANLYRRDTGLPMTIWVSPRGRARHDVRIKVCTTPGDRMDPTNTGRHGCPAGATAGSRRPPAGRRRERSEMDRSQRRGARRLSGWAAQHRGIHSSAEEGVTW